MVSPGENSRIYLGLYYKSEVGQAHVHIHYRCSHMVHLEWPIYDVHY